MPMIERATPPNVRINDETKLYPRYPSGLLENQSTEMVVRVQEISISQQDSILC